MTPIRRDRNAIRLLIPPEVIPILRELQAKQRLREPGIEGEDVVDLYYGLGPAYHLAFDGRVICDETDWSGDPNYEVADAKKAWYMIAIGANGFDCPSLRSLLPKRPPTAVTCTFCQGTALVGIPNQWFVCPLCDGLGWRIPGVAY